MADTSHATRQKHHLETNTDASIANSKSERVDVGKTNLVKVGTHQPPERIEPSKTNKNQFDVHNIFDDELVEVVKHTGDQPSDLASLFSGDEDEDIEKISASLIPKALASSPTASPRLFSPSIHRGLFTPTSSFVPSSSPSSLPVPRRQTFSHVEVPPFPKGLRRKDYSPIPRERPRSPSVVIINRPHKRTPVDSQLEMRDTLQAVLQNNGGLYTVSRQQHTEKNRSTPPPFMPSMSSSSSSSQPPREREKKVPRREKKPTEETFQKHKQRDVHPGNASVKRREFASTRYDVDKDEVQLIINGVPKDRHEVTVANTRFLGRAKNNEPIEYRGGTDYAVLSSDFRNIGQGWSPPLNESLHGQEDILSIGNFDLFWGEDEDDDDADESEEAIYMTSPSHHSFQQHAWMIDEHSQDAREVEFERRPTRVSQPLRTDGESSVRRPKPRPLSHKYSKPKGPAQYPPPPTLNHPNNEQQIQPNRGVLGKRRALTVESQHIPATHEFQPLHSSSLAHRLMTPQVAPAPNDGNTPPRLPYNHVTQSQSGMISPTNIAHEGNMHVPPLLQDASLEALSSLVSCALTGVVDLSKILQADRHASARVADSIRQVFTDYPTTWNEIDTPLPASYSERLGPSLPTFGQPPVNTSNEVFTHQTTLDPNIMVNVSKTPLAESGTIDPSLIMGNFAVENTAEAPSNISPSPPSSPAPLFQPLTRFSSPNGSASSISSSSKALESELSIAKKASTSSFQPQSAFSSQPHRLSRSKLSARDYIVLDDSGDEDWTLSVQQRKSKKTKLRRSYSREGGGYDDDEPPQTPNFKKKKKKLDKGRASRGNWLKQETSSYCHQCRCSTRYLKLECSCAKKYCIRCIRLRYTEDLTLGLPDTNFTCPSCKNCCTCDVCTRKRGEVYVSLKRSRADTRIEAPPKSESPHPLPTPASRSGADWATAYDLDGTVTGEVFTLDGNHTEKDITLEQQIPQTVDKQKRIYAGDLQESWNLGQYYTTAEVEPLSWKDRNNGPSERFYVGDKRILYIPVNRFRKAGARASSSNGNAPIHEDIGSLSSLSSLEDESDGGDGEGELCQGLVPYAAETDFEMAVQGGIDYLLRISQDQKYFEGSLQSADTSRAILLAYAAWGMEVRISTCAFIHGVPTP